MMSFIWRVGCYCIIIPFFFEMLSFSCIISSFSCITSSFSCITLASLFERSFICSFLSNSNWPFKNLISASFFDRSTSLICACFFHNCSSVSVVQHNNYNCYTAKIFTIIIMITITYYSMLHVTIRQLRWVWQNIYMHVQNNTILF